MQNKQSFITLMESLISSNSPAVKLNALYEFLRNEPDVLDKTEQDALISKFKIAKEAKSKAGLTDATKRWTEKKEKVKTLKEAKWLFMKSPYMKNCEQCKERYLVDDHIFLYVSGSGKNMGYHPHCAPQEAKDDQNSKVFYENYLKEAI
jgi:hypothetical protein